MRTDTPMKPVGECPNTPEDPISIEAYEAVIAAMDELIAQADARPGKPQDAEAERP